MKSVKVDAVDSPARQTNNLPQSSHYHSFLRLAIRLFEPFDVLHRAKAILGKNGGDCGLEGCESSRVGVILLCCSGPCFGEGGQGGSCV